MTNFAFCAQIIFCVSVQGRSEIFFIALGRSTLCEFSKTKFVQIGKCLTNWQLSKVAQNRQILIILIIFTKNVDVGQLWKAANRSNVFRFGQILFC